MEVLLILAVVLGVALGVALGVYPDGIRAISSGWSTLPLIYPSSKKASITSQKKASAFKVFSRRS
jgi:hypothetical protein